MRKREVPKRYNMDTSITVETNDAKYRLSPAYNDKNSYVLRAYTPKDAVEEVVIPHILPSGHKITGIAAAACFIICLSRIKSLTFAEGIEVLDDYCFTDISADSIYIPDTVKEIPDSCFEGSNISEVTGMKNVISIGKEAFRNANITKIHWPNKCSVIPFSCFKGCKKLVSVMGTENVKTIKRMAFTGCKKLQATCFPQADKIEERAFAFSGIKTFIWPKKCKNIPASCFYNSELSYLKDISDVEYIETAAFGYTSLHTLDLRESNDIFLDRGSLFGLPDDCEILLPYYVSADEVETARQQKLY